jgi:hypothetical protein
VPGFPGGRPAENSKLSSTFFAFRNDGGMRRRWMSTAVREMAIRREEGRGPRHG